MPPRSDSRQRMVRTTASLLRRQGFAATSWRQVVAESATPWGSQAHHFPGGKEQLAREAIAESGAAYKLLLQGALAATHPADAVRFWVETAARQLEGSAWADGCPVATVALETAHISDQLADACQRAFTSWTDALTRSFEGSGYTGDDAASLATLVLAAMEGAQLLARAGRDSAPLRSVGRELEKLLRSRIDGATGTTVVIPHPGGEGTVT
ncbi:MAG TPA: TetR family transcriptional regulator C-terminal domain-containing protein [Acidimicrobiales bacterium]|nr:TetR family transcriptional regulator C-terminal domain-containing protein [Acidimicrobiales bacterium]